MTHGASWVVRIGGDAVAAGEIVSGVRGLWMWRLGRPAPEPIIIQGAGFGKPFAWRGDHYLVRHEWHGDPRGFSLWRLDPVARQRCVPLSASEPGAPRVVTACRARTIVN